MFRWLRRLRCRLFYHGSIITCFVGEDRKSHDYCEYCDAIIRIHSLRNYLEWYWRKRYEDFPEEYAPLYEDGISLRSTAHPRPPWWQRPYWWIRVRFADVSEDSIETIEIEVPERKD